MSVALGDSPNDIGMLAAADIGVVVNSPGAVRMDVGGLPNVRRTTACGPSGWQETITAILGEHAPA